mgnify:CR=1 FL=1
MRETIDGALFKDMFTAGALIVEENRQAINELNVFPVPDGDTGTNMSLTMDNARSALSAIEPSGIGEAADITANALLRGARGNSGVILSLLFRGFARAVKDKKTADSKEFSAALTEGVAAAYKAVMKPSEGTILTVSRIAAAAACEAAENGLDIEGTLKAAIDAGYIALAETVEQNPVLKKAGVIDAGGKGYMLMLDAMLSSVKGEAQAWPVVGARSPETREKAVFSDFETEDINFIYCTEFIISRSNKKDPQLLSEFLGGIGDSVVVVDDDELIKVHVHNNCPGEVLTEALTYGSLLTVKIENMREQHTENLSREKHSSTSSVTTEPAAEKDTAVVAICAGEGLAQLFRELGADFIISGGQTMNPSTEDILEGIVKAGARTVFVLPNNKNIILAAEQCRALTDRNVIVIPTTTVPQGISAMMVMDMGASDEENSASMTEAAAAVRTVSVTYAARDSVFDGTEISEGDYIALCDGKLMGTELELEALIPKISEALLEQSPSCVTVFYGSDVNAGEAEAFSSALGELMHDVDLVLLDGGQPVYYYLISAE